VNGLPLQNAAEVSPLDLHSDTRLAHVSVLAMHRSLRRARHLGQTGSVQRILTRSRRTRRRPRTRGMGPRTFTVTYLADLLLLRVGPTVPARSLLWPGGLYVVGAALIGAVTGRIASRLRGTVRRRTVLLLVISPVGPSLLAATQVAIPPLSDLAVVGGFKALGFAAVMTLLSLPLALPYVVYLAPLVAPPVIVGHLVLEGWTRPSELSVTGFARPTVRRAVLLVLLASIAAFTTFALLRAQR
jgi:hypothetical protein